MPKCYKIVNHQDTITKQSAIYNPPTVPFWLLCLGDWDFRTPHYYTPLRDSRVLMVFRAIFKSRKNERFLM